MTKHIIPAILLFLPLSATAESVPFSDPRWEITGAESKIETIAGTEALFLRNGTAFLKDAEFHNGIIEFDIRTTGERGFSGAFFRFTSPGNGEDFYIRPHQSGKEDANQYTPVFNGLTAWQLYFGPAFSTPLSYRVNQWMHIKIVVLEKRADVYLDSEEPVLHIAELKQANVAGWIGVDTGFAPVHFANFSYQKSDDVEIVGNPAEMKTPAGLVKTWAVSKTFDEKRLTGPKLPPELLTDQTWQSLPVEDRGYANLARVQGIAAGANTAFARLTLTAAKASVKNISFGYSDRVKVYLNGTLLYAGNNGYMSRDYRYLGTVGLFDQLALDLNAGSNELLFAVSESFGGWGIMAAIEDRKGLVVTP